LGIDVEGMYRRYGPFVYRRCRLLLRNEEKALDATHDVFVQLLRDREGLRGDSHGGLLHRIATHVCLNRLRSERRKPEDEDDERVLRIADCEDLEARTLAGGLLDRLFEREVPSSRVIAALHLVDGMTLEEVAQEVGLSVSGVRKRLRGIKARLHEMEGLES
jgi:RNA polymerase sigma factor (sigma-70 family)